eukprot:1160649-Pelagomonas_calceolata.AAC.12
MQHQPVYTLGTGSSEGHLLFDPTSSTIPLYRTERGGEVTYHGPGQAHAGVEYRAQLEAHMPGEIRVMCLLWACAMPPAHRARKCSRPIP